MKWKNGMIVEATRKELAALYFEKFSGSFDSYDAFEWKAECEGCKVTEKEAYVYGKAKR